MRGRFVQEVSVSLLELLQGLAAAQRVGVGVVIIAVHHPLHLPALSKLECVTSALLEADLRMLRWLQEWKMNPYSASGRHEYKMEDAYRT